MGDGWSPPTRCTLHKSTVRFSRGQARLGWESRRAGRGGQSRGSRAGGPLLLSISTPRLTATYTKDHTDLRYPSPDAFPDQQLIVHATRLWVSAMEGLIKSGKHQWKRTWAFSGFLPAIKSAVHPLNEWNKIKGAESAVAPAVDSIPWPLRILTKQTSTKSNQPFKYINFLHVSARYSRKRLWNSDLYQVCFCCLQGAPFALVADLTTRLHHLHKNCSFPKFSSDLIFDTF